MATTNKIFNAIFEGGIEGLVIKAFDLFKEPIIKGGEDFLKAHTGGRGVHDEALFQNACAYAVSALGAEKTGINKLMSVINSLPANERRRIVEILGQDEQEVKSKVPVMENGTPVFDKKGNPLYKETSFKANVRGAEVIALLSTLEEDQIKEFFLASNSLDTPDKRRAETAKKIAESVNNLADYAPVRKVLDNCASFKSGAEAAMSQGTFLDNWAERIRAKQAEREARRTR